MYKVIVIDDDMIVRLGIKMIGKWEKYNLEVVGEASDGNQGMNLYRIYHPDLIISDIKMPGLDGIELLKEIRKYDKDTRIILLTNYDDKEYIKEALRYGANDFIAKNELNEESMDLFLSNQQIELEKLKKNSKNRDYSPEKRRTIVQFFMESLSRNAGYEKEFLKEFHIEEGKEFGVGIIQIVYKKENVSSTVNDTETIEKLIQITTGTLTGYPLSLIWESKWKTITAFVIDQSKNLTNKQLYEICQSISNAARLYTRLSLHICASNVVNKIEDLYTLKNQVEKAVMAATFFESQKVLMYGEIEEESVNSWSGKNNNLLKQMYLCGVGQAKQVRSISRQIILEASKNRNVSLKSLFCREFAAWYHRAVEMLDDNVKKEMVWIDSSLLQSEFDDKELEQEIDFLIDKIEKAYEGRKITENDTINQILYYIGKNYSSPITLSDAAEYVHLSKNYISTLFNHVMKESFAGYLARVRIEKAKDIMKLTDYRINEVSELVGFSSDKYFNVTFKNIVGMTPKEYRLTVRKL